MNPNIELGPGNYPTGYCPPEQPEQIEHNPLLSSRLGKVALGLLASAAIWGTNPSTIGGDRNPEVPLSALEAPPVPHEQRRAGHIHHETHSKPLAVIAIHKSTSSEPKPSPTATTTKPKRHRAPSQTTPSQTQTPFTQVYGNNILKIQPTAVGPSNDGLQHRGIVSNWVELDSTPYGYYLGQFNTSDQAIALATTEQKDYEYLAVRVHRKNRKPFWECGWAVTGAVAEEVGTKAHISSTAKMPCIQQIGRLANPFNFGHKFNCAPGKCVDGTYVTHLTPKCNDKIYRNDAALGAITSGKSLQYARSIKHPLYDLRGKVNPNKPIHYRFVPNENKTIDVRSNTVGWGVMPKKCVTGIPKGGPPKR